MQRFYKVNRQLLNIRLTINNDRRDTGDHNLGQVYHINVYRF